MLERHLAIVVPCYNEEARLPGFFEALLSYQQPLGWQVTWILVDDGSSDNTTAVIQEGKARVSSSQIRIESHRLQPNQGKGAAVREGARLAGDRFDAVGFLDVDLSTPLAAIADGIKLIEGGAELVIASRHAPGAELKKAQGFFRFLVGRLFSFFSSLFHRNSFTDTQCGLKIWTSRVNQSIATKLQAERWSFDLELILRCERLNLSVQEFAVCWTNDERSRISVLRDGTRMLGETLVHWWRWADKRLWFITLVFLIVGVSQATHSWNSSNDLSIYFTEAWRKVAHGDLNIYEVGRPNQGGYYYSPFFALIGSWLVFLGWPLLKWAYAILTCVGILVGWVLVKRLVRNASIGVTFEVGFLTLLFIGNNILGQMMTGNVSMWMNLLPLLAMYCSTRSRPVAAGFLWALAINIKVYPIYLVLYFLWKRDFHVLLWGAFFSLGFLLFPALFWGWDTNVQMHLRQIEMLKAYGPQNDFGRLAFQSFAAMAYRWFRAFSLDPMLGLKVGEWVAVVLNLVMLSRLKRDQVRDDVWAMAWTLACMALATPASWVHHSGFAYVLLFTLALSTALALKSTLTQALLIVGMALYALTTTGIVGSRMNDLLEAYSVPTYGLVLLVLAGVLSNLWTNKLRLRTY